MALRHVDCCRERSGVLKTTKGGKTYLVCINKGCGKVTLHNVVRRDNEVRTTSSIIKIS